MIWIGLLVSLVFGIKLSEEEEFVCLSATSLNDFVEIPENLLG